jgi:osmotically-inducible protein OsmY
MMPAVGAAALLWLASVTVVEPPGVIVDRGVTLNDQWLRAKVEVALFEEPRVSGTEVGDLVVQARGDRVVLRGTVDSVEARRTAVDVAQRVPGVRSVGDELAVVPGTAAVPRANAVIARDVAIALRQTQALAGSRIRLTAQGATGELFGTVRDMTGWAIASRIARDVVGVHAVDNHLAIDDLELGSK